MKTAPLAAAFLAAAAYAKEHIVTVGKGGELKFVPEDLGDVHVGDKITYKFFAKNHAVTQSTFDKPCQPMEGGFFSGFTPVADENESPTTFTIHANDTKPIWVYCAQTNGDHCQKGMVSSINALEEKATFAAFKDLALKADKPSSSPEDGLPVGGLRLTKVVVGAGGKNAFSPDNVDALKGEIIRFSYNPKNHSVVQADFDSPCIYKKEGFSSGFVPIEEANAGNVTFDYHVDEQKPVWFYCAQPGGGGHCRASGMVGSLNAPKEGDKTLEAFRELAKKSPDPTIPANAPIGGILSFKGYPIPDVGGNVLDVESLSMSPDMLDVDYKVGEEPPHGIIGMAGGGPPASYGWANPELSSEAEKALQLLHYIDNVLSYILLQGHVRMGDGGGWSSSYTSHIKSTFGSMAAQSVIHRRTSSDCLDHYSKEKVPMCKYVAVEESEGVKPFLNQVLTLSLLSLGATIDALAVVAKADEWLVPVLATQLGAKARALALFNLMQGHGPATSPREVQIPMALAHSYIHESYVSECPSETTAMEENWGKTWPLMEVKDKKMVYGADTGKERLVSMYIAPGDMDFAAAEGDDSYYMAWIGSWGHLTYTKVNHEGHVIVPSHMYGHVWAAVVKGKDYKLAEIEDHMVAGPEMVWVSQP